MERNTRARRRSERLPGVIAFLLILAGAIAAVLVGLALRLPSLVSTVLASYLAWVVNLGLVTLVLSPFREVDRGGLGGCRGDHPGGAFAAWWLRGRFVPSFAPARAALAEVASSPWTLLFLIAVVALLGYELALGLTMPSNNWDASPTTWPACGVGTSRGRSTGFRTRRLTG